MPVQRAGGLKIDLLIKERRDKSVDKIDFHALNEFELLVRFVHLRDRLTQLEISEELQVTGRPEGLVGGASRHKALEGE